MHIDLEASKLLPQRETILLLTRPFFCLRFAYFFFFGWGIALKLGHSHGIYYLRNCHRIFDNHPEQVANHLTKIEPSCDVRSIPGMFWS